MPGGLEVGAGITADGRFGQDDDLRPSSRSFSDEGFESSTVQVWPTKLRDELDGGYLDCTVGTG